MSDAPVLALTGGSGFIGRHFAAAARASGYRLRQLARRRWIGFDPRDELCLADLTVEVDDAMLRGCGAVVHLAAYIPRDHDDPAEAARCWQVNALGTLNLAAAAVAAGVPRFVQTTSANAYASTHPVPDESAPLFPRSRGYYLGSKILQEIYAAEACGRGDTALTTLRLSAVYGAGQTAGAVATIAGALMRGAQVRLADGGGYEADFVWVADVVRALLLILGGAQSGVFNVGSGERMTIAELTDTLAEILGSDPALIACAPPEPNGDRGFPPLDIAKLRALGYVPTPLGTALAAMVAPVR